MDVPSNRRPFATAPGRGKDVADVWFELAIEQHGWALLYLGVHGGSRRCTQTLRLTLSDVYNPLPERAVLAKRARTNGLPCTFEIDSEGPKTRISLVPGPGEDRAELEVRGTVAPAIYFVAIVDPRNLGIALAHALRVAIHDVSVVDRWESWYGDDTSRCPRPYGVFRKRLVA